MFKQDNNSFKRFIMGVTTYRNEPKRTEMDRTDRNRPKRTTRATETDFSGYRNGLYSVPSPDAPSVLLDSFNF